VERIYYANCNINSDKMTQKKIKRSNLVSCSSRYKSLFPRAALLCMSHFSWSDSRGCACVNCPSVTLFFRRAQVNVLHVVDEEADINLINDYFS